jgi:hypothetical protein
MLRMEYFFSFLLVEYCRMERIVKNTGSFKTSLEIDGSSYASSSLNKWYRIDAVFKKDDQVLALLKKDKFWKWDLTLFNDEGVLMTCKPKLFKDTKFTSKDGVSYVFKKNGASENTLTLFNEQGQEVLVMEKQGVWWKHRPYLVKFINPTDLPYQEDLLPLVVVAAMRILNQRAAWIAPIVIFSNLILRKIFGE